MIGFARSVAAVMVLLVHGAAAALPATTAGSPDPTFGTGGSVISNPTAGDDDWGGGVLQPDGKLVVTGYVARTATASSFAAIRFLDSGELDPSFGSGGRAELAIDLDGGADSGGPALDGAGRIFIAGYSNPDTLYRCTVAALLPGGALDPSFADAGVFRYTLDPGKHTNCTSATMQGENRILVSGTGSGTPTEFFVLRLTLAGAIDASFGTQGVARLPAVAGRYWRGAVTGADGSIYIAASDNTFAYVYKLTASGALDTTYGTGGMFKSAITDVGVYQPRALADGSLLVPGYHGAKQTVFKLTPNGALAPGFGTGGVAEFGFGPGYSAVAVDVQKDGKIVVALRLHPAAAPRTWRLAVARLNPDGSLDASYGTAGGTVVASTIDHTTIGMALAPDDKVWVFGRADLSGNDSGLAVARLLGNEITTDVVEFYNSTLVHYFITADPNEAAAIDAGAAGPGWTRTGNKWKSGGPNRVCRFYGSPDIVPATGLRRGPNSHFYTIDPAECAAVKLDPGWRFESYDFNGWPATAGACPAGTVAVRRAYNNRFAQNDSNHRYATDPAVYDAMLGQGWGGEGTVFCAGQ